MKKLLILGAGTGGTIMANKMFKSLSRKEWEITVVESMTKHYYQPGFLFLSFCHYTPEQVEKKTSDFLPKGIKLITGRANKIETSSNTVILEDGKNLNYDILIIATGTRIIPAETPGLDGPLWHKKIFDFYTFEGAMALRNFFSTWEGGTLVVNIADMPIKCPVAPLEFVFYADACLTRKGIRDKVNIKYVTPLSGAFTKPYASKVLGSLLVERKIELVTDFAISEVNNEEKKIVDFGGREVEFDCLVSIPLHFGDEVMMTSGLADEFGFVKANKNTLQSVSAENVFVIGDAGNFPASKAGSVVHFQADILTENLHSFIHGKPMTASFDGHSNCFIETGYGKGILIDFNYEVEPLPGHFPIPVLGPLPLMKISRLNHWGKLAFKWIYWNILLKARWFPLPSKMSMVGKKQLKS